MSDLTVTVKLRWTGASLYAGPFHVGYASQVGPHTLPSPWVGACSLRWPSSARYPTEAEARAAVEQAAIKVLGGHADE